MPKRTVADIDLDGPDWSSYTVPELKDALGHRGLSRVGRKAELIARLENHEALKAAQVALPPGTASTEGAEGSATRAPKAKKAKTHGPELVLDGPLASEVIKNQWANRETGERRPREFVPAPDDKFKDKVKRINKERMFMLDRKMVHDANGHREETFTIAGSTGNIYTCTIGKSPKCDCMDAVSIIFRNGKSR